MYSYGAGTSGGGRPYQGYPYVNPMVNDVATIDAETAAKWSALPRRPGILYEQPGTSRQDVDSVTGNRETEPKTSQEQTLEESPSNKIDYDANPVVYIEVPESSGSEVAEQMRPPIEDSFVEQTIFYDQFKGRTVVTVSDDARSNTSSSSGSTHSFGRSNRPTRPAPPVTLTLRSPDSGYPSSSRSTPGLPPIMSKESSVYGGFSADQDVEIREFPNPPPAYSVFDTMGTPLTPVTSQPRPPAASQQLPVAGSPLVLNPVNLPPRTQVIVPPIDSENSKVVICIHCGETSPSIMIKQVGFATHLLALLFFLCGLIPCTILVYYFNCCRYKNHYCKQCNNLMAYEIPFLCRDLTYVT